MFSNWSKSSYYTYLFGLLSISALSILAHVTIIGLIGAIFGFTSVVLIVNKKKQAGYVGMVSAVIYAVVSYGLGNYSDALLNVLFILFLNIPLILNRNYQNDKKPKTIKGNYGLLAELLILWITIFITLFITEVDVFSAPRPFWSVLAASFGIIASISTSFFMLKESFWIWTIQNILQVLLFGITLYQTKSGIALLMMVTYIFYTINATTAFFNGKWYEKQLGK